MAVLAWSVSGALAEGGQTCHLSDYLNLEAIRRVCYEEPEVLLRLDVSKVDKQDRVAGLLLRMRRMESGPGSDDDARSLLMSLPSNRLDFDLLYSITASALDKDKIVQATFYRLFALLPVLAAREPSLAYKVLRLTVLADGEAKEFTDDACLQLCERAPDVYFLALEVLTKQEREAVPECLARGK